MIKQFKENLLLRKKSDKLVKKLEEIGYSFSGYDALDNEEPCIMTYSDMFSGGLYSFTQSKSISVYDCGSDEQLFLSLAALTDETKLHQLYLCHRDYYDSVMDGSDVLLYKNGDMVLCTDLMDDFLNHPDCFHKASKEEIIDYFKKKENERYYIH